MSEFRKIPEHFIKAAKPDKGDFPFGMALLNRHFFEKLEQNILPGGRKFFEELLSVDSPGVALAIEKLLPFIRSQELKNQLVSQILADKNEGYAQGSKSYLAGHSSETRHHELYSAVPRKQLEGRVDEKGVVPYAIFPKTGSSLDLLADKYIGKEIVRIIKPESYECWKKALEAKGVWEEAGFDYIPIEPILVSENGELQAKKLKDGKVAVLTGVLGHNLHSFAKNKKNRKYVPKLVEQGNKILAVLNKKLQIAHGHAHQYNFCVEPYNGDFRIYLIDLDQAKNDPNAQD